MSNIIGKRCIHEPSGYFGTVIGRSDKLPGYLKVEYDNLLGFIALTDINDLVIDGISLDCPRRIKINPQRHP